MDSIHCFEDNARDLCALFAFHFLILILFMCPAVLMPPQQHAANIVLPDTRR